MDSAGSMAAAGVAGRPSSALKGTGHSPTMPAQQSALPSRVSFAVQPDDSDEEEGDNHNRRASADSEGARGSAEDGETRSRGDVSEGESHVSTRPLLYAQNFSKCALDCSSVTTH
jgi:hypothetical protein